MANNRMYLVCSRCLQDESTKWDDCVVYVEKYYPSMGWMADDATALGERLNGFFRAHMHGSALGEEFRIIYESSTKFGKDKQRIMDAISDTVAWVNPDGSVEEG